MLQGSVNYAQKQIFFGGGVYRLRVIKILKINNKILHFLLYFVIDIIRLWSLQIASNKINVVGT